MTRLVRTAAVLLVLATAACGGGGTKDASSTTTTTSARAVTSTTTRSTTTSAVAGPKLQHPATTARDWLKAVASGDDDAAIALTARASLDKVGGAEGFKKMHTEIAQGWGAWGRATGVDTTQVGIAYPPSDTLVVLHGEVSQEGPPRETWAALPVVATDAGDRVEPFLDFGAITPKQADGSTIDAQQTFEVTTPASGDVYFIVDDHASVVAGVLSVDQDGEHTSYTPNDALASGAHGLTVVIVAPDGVQVRTFQYRVS